VAGKFLQGMRSKRARYLSLLLRWGVLIGVVVLINSFVSSLLDVYVEKPTLQAGMVFGSTILLLLVLYAVLLAIPFFPGAEVGILILTTQGSSAAPFVYLATVLGLLTSYFMGLAFSSRLKYTLLKSLGLQRTADFVKSMQGLAPQERLVLLQDSAPSWIGNWVISRRYILIALLLNIPGNSMMGGGGGILFLSGLSRLFSNFYILLTITLAVLPVPALVYFFGVDLFK